jgi:hypothetical protein
MRRWKYTVASRDGRHDAEHEQRQARVQRRHDRERARHVEKAPHDVHRAPRDGGADLVGVAHHAGEDAAHGRRVVVIEAERLQMHEQRALEVAPDVHLHGDGRHAEHDDAEHGERDDAEIRERVSPQAVQLPRHDEAVDRPAQQQRVGQIAQRGQNHQKDDRQQLSPVGPEKRAQLFPHGPVEAAAAAVLSLSRIRLAPLRFGALCSS